MENHFLKFCNCGKWVVIVGALPSLPPWGWSIGFITTSLTIERIPSQHLDQTLLKLFWFTLTLLTCLTVTEQFLDIKRIYLEGNFYVADFLSFAISFVTTLAALANFAKDFLCMWKRPVPIIMILRMDNSSISCSFATKYFLCAVVKEIFFWREILFHQSSYRYSTYLYLTIFYKVVTKQGITCTILA